MSWHPVIDTSRCEDNCFKCVAFCPKNVFDKAGARPFAARPGDCVDGCEGCKSVCPKDALSFTRSDAIIIDGQEIGLQGLDEALRIPKFQDAWQCLQDMNYIPDTIAEKVKKEFAKMYESSCQ